MSRKPCAKSASCRGERRLAIKRSARLPSGLAPARFDGMTLTTHEDGTTVLEGLVVDQAALHGLLAKLRDIGLPLMMLLTVAV